MENPSLSFHTRAGGERRVALDEQKRRAVECPPEQCVHRLFEEQARRAPEALAVADGRQQLTYYELDQRADRLARHLEALGVGPETCVAVCLERSVELVIAFLAALKAGGAYLPVDPTHPLERLELMLSDARAPVLLVAEPQRPELIARISHCRVLAVNHVSAVTAGSTRSVPALFLPKVHAKNLAYVIYTSGSTGTPKGVEVEHASLTNLVRWHRQAYAVTPADRASLVASPAFDAATWEIWPYLTAGASLHIPSDAIRRSPTRLLAWLMTNGITLSFVPTPLAEAMLEETWPERCPLRALLTGGEKLKRGAPANLPCALVNNYGPTETTVVATSGRVPAGGRELHPSIGYPIRNTEIYVLDEHRQPVAPGVPGELYIGGAGLARGYLNSPDLTAERFVPHPFSAEPGARLYRSGDIVRLCPDGSLEFIGRAGNQVKIRGCRVDLGEIESVLRSHPGVRDAVVVASSNDSTPAMLVAYVTLRAGEAPPARELEEFLKCKLPEYMVPATFEFLDELPLSSNGKIDRRALPAPRCESGAPFAAPRTATERGLAAIWEELLDRERVGIQDNFFHLGGHSLLAARVLSRIERRFQVELQLADLFSAPTLGALAELIDAAAAVGAEPGQEEPARMKLCRGSGGEPMPGDRDEPPFPGSNEPENGESRHVLRPTTGNVPGEPRPLSFAQERLWFLEQLEPGVPFNNVPFAWRARGRLDPMALERAFDAIIRRHETWRNELRERQGRPMAWPRGPGSFHLPVFDLSALPPAEQKAETQRLIAAEARRSFDLTRGPLLRAALLRLGPEDQMLVLTTHHIACDGWSMGIFHRELSEVYAALAQGRSWALPELPLTYGDFVSWQRGWAEGPAVREQLAYWRKKLAGAPTILALPTDRPRPPVLTYSGAIHRFRFPAGLHEKLAALSQREEVTMFMLLLAAWQTLLHRYSAQEEIVVGSPIAGRTCFETEGLIGIFLNLLVLRGDLSGDPPLTTLLKRLRDVALAAYQHQDLPFEKLVDALQPDRDLSRTPLFQVMFVWHNEPMAPMQLSGLQLEPVHVHNGTSKFDLTLSLEPAGDGLEGYIEYNTDLFDEVTIVRMAGHLRTLLEGIVANPGERLSALPVLTDTERRQLLVGWNETQAAIPELCVHDCFEAQVRRAPDAVAVVFGNDQLTYRELDGQANALAARLRELGVRPDDRVGLCLERSLEMMVGLMAILKAGGAYLPLDLNYPKDRLVFMLEDAQVRLVLGGENFDLARPVRGASTTNDSMGPSPLVVKLKGSRDSARRFVLKTMQPEPASNGSRNGDAHAPTHTAQGERVSPHHLAYVIYTSGSTGKPKGVMVTHRNVLNFFVGMDALLGTEPGIWLAVTSISFDISVLELFWTLARGYKVILHHDLARGSSGLPPWQETAKCERVTAAPRTSSEPGPLGETPLAMRRGRAALGDSPAGLASSALASRPGWVSGSTTREAARGMDFSLFYFASDASDGGENKYRLLTEGARFADAHGFTAVWTPERHFHAFGGLYPNPSITGAALAMVTERIRIRAGSVVLPLHDVVRVAEEWAVLDNLSRGRVDISFASGWHTNDFVLCPENYADRHAALFRQIDEVRRLWRGEPLQRRNGSGQEVAVRILPRPIQPELPFWITAAGSPETCRKAGEAGANLLTHLLGQSIEELANKIALYRTAWNQAGHPPGKGRVTLMLHTFVGHDADTVRETVREPFSEYLKTSMDLIARDSALGFDPKKLSPDDVNALIARVFDRYLETSGLFGTPATCLKRVDELKRVGVDEIACLIDFGVEQDTVLDSLTLLNEVRHCGNDHRGASGAGWGPGDDGALDAATLEVDPSVETAAPEEPPSILEQILRHGVTHLQCTPSLAAMLLQDPLAANGLGALQKLLLGGEALSVKLAREIQVVVAGEIINLYGPTETTVWSAAHVVRDVSHTIPIGRPLANTELFIVDGYDRLVPIGVPGELLIGGAGLTQGYHRRPELTEEKFVRHFAIGTESRVYRTGDRARYRPDGQIEFLGRIDHQVKVRGHRIELGEIETVLGRHSSVKVAVVAAWGDSPAEQRLVAYVVAKAERVPAPGESARGSEGVQENILREFLRRQLPDYMMPSAFMLLAALPLTANGKVDRRALPPPEDSCADQPAAFVGPSTQTEEALAGIWSEVLGRKRVSVHDNFFELGGHSLLIMQVLTRVRETFQIDLRMRYLFDSPTIAGLASVIEEILPRDINERPETEADKPAEPERGS
jgi:natural product biosynthesis luciferase-like monooxygenase protein/amino acid adenylation domain-containing protein